MGLKTNNNRMNNRNIFMRHNVSYPRTNPNLQRRPQKPIQTLSMYSSVRRPCAQLQFGGTPGCGCGK